MPWPLVPRRSCAAVYVETHVPPVLVWKFGMAERIRRDWRLPRYKGRATQSNLHGSVSRKGLGDPHQRVSSFLLIPQAHRQKVAPGAVLAGPLVKFLGGNVGGDEANLF